MHSFKQVLYWLIAGSKGGINRARILGALEKKPMNSNTLSTKLKLDYKTVQHHIKLLQQNQLIVNTGSRYGKVFFISPQLKDEWQLFEEMLKKGGVENED